MLRNRKLSMSTLATIAGTAILITTTTPFTASANWPWDEPGPNTVLSDFPWDDPSPNAAPVDDDFPWDGPGQSPTGTGSLA